MADEPDSEQQAGSLEADDLYALDPADFVAARKDLVRRLRAAGRREDAARAATRRRPSPVAWALDQVARHDAALVERALTAGARLRAATEKAVAGDAGELRAATAEDRAASDAVVDAAQGRLGGRGAALRPQLAATLRAAALDDELAAELRRGVLATDHDAPGFGWSAFEEAVAVPAPPPSRVRQDGARPSHGAPASEEQDGREQAQGAPASGGPARDRKDERERAQTRQPQMGQPRTRQPREGNARGRPPGPTPGAPPRSRAADEMADRDLEERHRARAEAEEKAREERRRAHAEARVTELEKQAADLTRAAERAEAAARQARTEADAAVEQARAARRALDEQ